MNACRIHRRPCLAAGFTLVEVILAIVIALGILVVLLYFYQQATHVRAQAIQETERIAATRLLMDRITGELRAISPGLAGQAVLTGSSNSIQFVKTDVPSYSAWMGGPLGRSTFPVTDRKRVRYQLESSLDMTNVAGLLRSEEPLVQQVISDDDLMEDMPSTLAGASPVLEEIRFLQFRYWSGTNWLDSWNAPGFPEGVEISMGAEPVTNGPEYAESGDVFRRVVYLGRSGTIKPGPSTNVTEEAP